MKLTMRALMKEGQHGGTDFHRQGAAASSYRNVLIYGIQPIRRQVLAMSRYFFPMLAFDGPFTTTYQSKIVELAAKARFPGMYGFREFVDEGGLASYGTSLLGIYQRFAYYVDKILRGAKPVDLPVEQPTKLELLINLKTAKALGIAFSHALLARADEVMELLPCRRGSFHTAKTHS